MWLLPVHLGIEEWKFNADLLLNGIEKGMTGHGYEMSQSTSITQPNPTSKSHQEITSHLEALFLTPNLFPKDTHCATTNAFRIAN
jgi:hypothetical protein